MPWWTDPANADILKARQECLILNLTNELGYWEWADDSGSALAAYTSAYKTAIAAMRAAGYTCPLMIDAPDCGSKLSAFTAAGDGGLTVGAELVAADSLGNILLSAHAYWAGYDGRPFIPTAIAANLPIVFGEIANKQDEVVDGNTVYCYYDLDGTHVAHPTTTGFTYQSFLTSLVPDQIGWLAGLVLDQGQLLGTPDDAKGQVRRPGRLRQRPRQQRDLWVESHRGKDNAVTRRSDCQAFDRTGIDVAIPAAC